MQVIDVMSTTVYTASERTPVVSALRIMAAHHVSSLPVVDDHGAVLGIVSEQDVLRRSVDSPRSVPGASRGASMAPPQRVGEVMTWAPHTVAPDADVADVVRIFSMMSWKCLPVVRHGQLVGVISRSDVVQALGRPDDAVRADVELALEGAGLGNWRAAVEAGSVILTGDGPSADRDRATDVARAVVGVRSVRVLASRAAQ